MRIILDGKGYDLSAAFVTASLSDWRAFIVGTRDHEGKARGSGDVQRGVAFMEERSKRIKKTGNSALTPDDELVVITVVTDLLFLARRQSGERTLSYGDVADGVSYLEVVSAFAEASERAAVVVDDDGSADDEADPTQA